MIDNIFIDKGSSYSISPWINGLSDHDAQILCLKVHDKLILQPTFYYTRVFNEQNIASFLLGLVNEQWSGVFEERDENKMFNNFLNVYMRYHQANLPIIKKSNFRHTKSPWISKGIVISCQKKRALYSY
jgi:hypothetical protein